MSQLQAWFLDQSSSFQTEFNDFRSGEPPVTDRNAEWQRG